MFPIVVPDIRAHVDAIVQALTDGLPEGYGVYEATGPANPSEHVPYVVFYANPGAPVGAPFCPGQDLALTLSVRGVGLEPWQAQTAVSRARTILLSGTVAVTGRAVRINQDDAQPPPLERDDSISPALFNQLVIFDVRSTPQ